jgi:hypothetical protein
MGAFGKAQKKKPYKYTYLIPEEGVIAALRIQAAAHDCRFCTVRLPAGTCSICKHCRKRPEADELVEKANRFLAKKARKRYTDSEVLSAYCDKGQSLRSIVDEFGLSNRLVYKILNEYDIPRRQSPWPAVDILVLKRVIKEYQEKGHGGEGYREEFISLRPQYSLSQVATLVQKLGIAPRHLLSKKEKEFISDHHEEMTLDEMGARLHRSVGAVAKVIETIREEGPQRFNINDVSTLLGITEHKVKQLVDAEILVAGNNGHHYVITLESLKEFLCSHPLEWSIANVSKGFMIKLLRLKEKKNEEQIIGS